MQTIDISLRPFLVSGNRYEAPTRNFSFPSSEVHIEIRAEQPDIMLRSRLELSDDIIRLLLAVDALKRQGVRSISLYAPWIPYARQDRVAIEGEPLSAAVMAKLLDSCGFRVIYTLHPHSDVLPALLTTRVVKLSIWGTVADAVGKFDMDVAERKRSLTLVAPDAGAAKWVSTLAGLARCSFTGATKKREVSTGRLEMGSLYGADVDGKDCLIVDDICDGGGTFVQLAKKLRANNARSVHLYVSHGIFSHEDGVQHLINNGIDFVTTTDSFQPVADIVRDPVMFNHVQVLATPEAVGWDPFLVG